MQGFDRNVMLDGSVYGHHEIASIEFYIGSYLVIQVRSWRDMAAKETDPTEFHTMRILDYGATDTITIDVAYDRVMADDRFAEYVDPTQSALDELLPTLTDEQADIIPQVFPVWALNTLYTVGQRCRYNDILYRCIQEHTSLEGYEPPNVPALWTRNGASGGIEEWVQPTGSEDAYNTGDKVTHNGKTWESNCDANVWEPGVYGWDEIN